MNQRKGITAVFLAGSGVVLALSGCSGSATSAATSGTDATGASSTGASVSPSPRQTQSDVTTAAAAPASGSGDFCTTQGAWLDIAAAYVSSNDDHDLAVKYMALAKRTNDLAPAAIREDVRITAGLATSAVEGMSGVASSVQIDPQTPERITAAAGAVKAWTQANCSAEIAAKWDRK